MKTSWRTGHKCPTASFLATGGFVKLCYKIPWYFHDYSGFFQISWFFHAEIVFSDFPGFPWFPELVGTLELQYIVVTLNLTKRKWKIWFLFNFSFTSQRNVIKTYENKVNWKRNEVVVQKRCKTVYQPTNTVWRGYNIKIYHECESRIEKSVPMIAVWHHEAILPSHE